MSTLNITGRYITSFVMEMAISVGPDQMVSLRISFDQACSFEYLSGSGLLHATLYIFLIFMYK